MKTFPIPTDEESEATVERQVRSFIRHWMALLAAEDYNAAVGLILPEISDVSRSVGLIDGTEWTQELLQAVIANYGTPRPIKGHNWIYKVVPIDDSLRQDFEAGLSVDLRRFETIAKDYLGCILVDLPLNYEEGNAVGALTARFVFQRVGPNEGALALLDIHVM